MIQFFGTFLFFAVLSSTAIYISYISKKNHTLLTEEAKKLEESLVERNFRGEYSGYSASQAWFIGQNTPERRVTAREKARNTFGGKVGTILIPVARVVPFSLVFLFIFLNDLSPVKFDIFSIIIIGTYIFLVLLSEILSTISYSNYIRKVTIEKLGISDYKVLIRTSYILKARKKQFLVIASLLLIYGIFWEVLGDLLISGFAVIEVGFLSVFANPAWADYIVLLFIITAVASVLIASMVVYGYVRFCKLLIKINPPENVLPSKLLDIRFNKQVAVTCHSYLNVQHSERGAS